MAIKKYHVSANLFDESTVTLGKVWYQGGERNSTIGGYSDYIEVTPETSYYLTNVLPLSTWYSACAYTSSKQFIDYCNFSSLDATEGTITTPQDCRYIIINFNKSKINEVMVNIGSTALPYEPYGNTWQEIPYRKFGTATDTITTLPTEIIGDGTNASAVIKGNMQQTGTPTPQNPIYPQECGDLETEGAHAGQYKIPISSGNTTTTEYLGQVQSTRQIAKYEFTGNESVFSGNVENNTVYFGFGSLLDTFGLVNYYNRRSLNSHAITATSGNNPQSLNYVCAGFNPAKDYSNTYYIRIDFDTIGVDTTASVTERQTAFKSWLAAQYAAGTPVTVWYVLATPTTGIVNEPIRKIGTYSDSVTGTGIPTTGTAETFDVDTALKPSEVSLTYHGWHEHSDTVFSNP